MGCSADIRIKITFDDNSQLTSIGKYSFENCSILTSIHYNGTVAQWEAITKDYH